MKQLKKPISKKSSIHQKKKNKKEKILKSIIKKDIKEKQMIPKLKNKKEI